MNRVQYIEIHINFICFDGIVFPKKKALLKFTVFCLFEEKAVPGQIVILVPGCFGMGRRAKIKSTIVMYNPCIYSPERLKSY